MNNKVAKVSIVVPCYKMGKYLRVALESVKAQNFQNWQLIIVEDCGPSDGTLQILKNSKNSVTSERFKMIRHHENLGVSASRNDAIEHSDGELVAFLDPDDYWHPDYLKLMLQQFEQHSAEVVYTSKKLCGEDGSPTGRTDKPSGEELRSFPTSLYYRNFINPSCVVLRRDCLPSLRPFDETPEIQHHEDWDLWLRLIHAGKAFHFLDQDGLSFYRRHKSAATFQGSEINLSRRKALWVKHSQNPDFARVLAEQLVEAKHKMLQLERQTLSGLVKRIWFKLLLTLRLK
jgi:glycosyltransferase involved in cell wall biosynthesis